MGCKSLCVPFFVLTRSPKGANLVSPKSGRFSLPTGEGDGGEADVTWGVGAAAIHCKVASKRTNTVWVLA